MMDDEIIKHLNLSSDDLLELENLDDDSKMN